MSFILEGLKSCTLPVIGGIDEPILFVNDKMIDPSLVHHDFHDE